MKTTLTLHRSWTRAWSKRPGPSRPQCLTDLVFSPDASLAAPEGAAESVLVADLVAVFAAEVCAALFLLHALADNAMAATPTTTIKRFIYAFLQFDQGRRN